MGEVKRYRKKPVVIEAIQILPENEQAIREFTGIKPDWEATDFQMQLRTTHGDLTAFRTGDWIVPDRKLGTFYPIADDVFKDTYDDAE